MNQQARYHIEGIEEAWSPLLQADALAAAHYLTVYGRTKLSEPEKRLMLAVLTDAIQIYQGYFLRRKVVSKVQYEQAEQWIWEINRQWPFSFDNICDTLGFNPQYVRRGLQCWKERTVSQPAPRARAAQRIRVSPGAAEFNNSIPLPKETKAEKEESSAPPIVNGICS